MSYREEAEAIILVAVDRGVVFPTPAVKDYITYKISEALRTKAVTRAASIGSTHARPSRWTPGRR